jgi:Right handed beta helix region
LQTIKWPASLLAWLLASLGVLAGTVPDLGQATTPARDFDLQGFIDRQIQTGTNCVVIPPGHYRVAPEHKTHLLFQNLTNVQVVADGVEMDCTETRTAVRINQCRDLHLRGLTVDYDPLPMTEGRIVALAPDKSWLELQIFTGYPDNYLMDRIEIYDPATGELRRASYYGWGPFKRIGPGRYRVSKGANYRYRPGADTEQVGDILVTNNEFPKGASGHAVELTGCTGVTLEDVTLYAAPVFGFLEDQCDGDTYLRCKIDRRPQSDDLIKRGFARMRSLNADAFHSVGATKGPAILDCVAKFNGDDDVNIHGRYEIILASTGSVLRVAAFREMSIKSGDQVEFLPFAGERPPDAVVTHVEPDSPITLTEEAFVQTQKLTPRTKARLLAESANLFRVTLDRPVDLPMGSLIAAANRLGNGFVVKGCEFGYNRSRGILIKANHGQVTDNTIAHGWMAAVLVSPEFNWLEAGSSSDVLIARNKIIGCRQPAIQVVAVGGKGQSLDNGAHRDITISSNRIIESVWPNIRVTSTANLVVTNNQLTPVKSEAASLNRTISEDEPVRQILVEKCMKPQLQSVP